MWYFKEQLSETSIRDIKLLLTRDKSFLIFSIRLPTKVQPTSRCHSTAICNTINIKLYDDPY